MASSLEDLADIIMEALEFHEAPVISVEVVDRRRIVVELIPEA